MRGETVLLDGVAVDNVLVEPGLSRDAEDIQLPAGTVVDYTLRFPIAHRGPVHDAKVTVRGRELDTLVFADHLHPAAVFGTWHGDWDMTVIVAEHDISLMARYCDVCVIMKQGSIVAVGKPKDIITEDIIREVYEVDSRIGLDADGEIYVLPKDYIGDE